VDLRRIDGAVQRRAPGRYTDSNPQKCFFVAIADNRQKVGNGRSVAVRLCLSCCSYWRSLGETAEGFRNADKSEGSRITCSLSDTTCVYHRAIVWCDREIEIETETKCPSTGCDLNDYMPAKLNRVVGREIENSLRGH